MFGRGRAAGGIGHGNAIFDHRARDHLRIGRAVERIADHPAGLGRRQRRRQDSIIVLGEVDAVARDVAAGGGVREHGVDARRVGAAVWVTVAPSEPAAVASAAVAVRRTPATSLVDSAERDVGDDEHRPAGVGGDLVEDR